MDMANQTVDMVDEEASKEVKYVSELFGTQLPSCRSGNSLLVKGVSKTFFMKQ